MPSPHEGFTFIEVLIAIVILAIMAAVVFQSAIGLQNAAAETRLIEESRMLASQIAAETWLGRYPSQTVAGNESVWNIAMNTVAEGEGDNRVVWDAWTISPKSRPSCRMAMYLRGRK